MHRCLNQRQKLTLQRAVVTRGTLAQCLGPRFGHVLNGKIRQNGSKVDFFSWIYYESVLIFLVHLDDLAHIFFAPTLLAEGGLPAVLLMQFAERFKLEPGKHYEICHIAGE